MKTRVLLVSIVPPRNDCGVRIVMYRHFVERNPFELYVASTADFADDLLVQTRLRPPHPLWRLRTTRFSPHFGWHPDIDCVAVQKVYGDMNYMVIEEQPVVSLFQGVPRLAN